jgi:hypothetical protein
MAPKKSKKKSAARPLKKARAKTRVAKKKVARRSKPVKKTIRPKKGFAGKAEVVDAVVYEPAGLGARSGGQSGDLQGLSDRRRAGAESVDELLQEGNAFEAEVIKGVEDVVDEEEVRTHEVPEDDVPDEYLDKD